VQDVFLSYSREDQPTARRFAQGFERAGLSVWWDQSLSAGEDYDEVTEKALAEAGAVAVLWSRRSVVSRWVRAEATQADRNGTLVPAMIEPCNRPIMFELKQTADLSNWSGEPDDPAWQAYLASVRKCVEKHRPSAATAAVPPVPDRVRRRSAAFIALTVAGLLVVGLGAWLLVRRHDDAANSRAALQPAGAMADESISLAVLPFANLSSDPEQGYFSDGLTEELLNQLAQVPGLRVIGRTSSFALKGKNEDLRSIGKMLGVGRILEGGVRKAGDRVRITATLINPADGTQLWSDVYERKLDDIFAVQEEISHTVAEALQVHMGAGGGTGSGTKNVAAFDAFLAGRALLSSGVVAEAIAHLERAVALDPEFVPAWLWLIDGYMRVSLGESQVRPAAIRRQTEAIDRVIALAPGTPEASLALSYQVARGHDLQKLEQLLQESLKMSGSQGVRAQLRYAQFLLGVGRSKPALAELERVVRNDPLDADARLTIAQTHDRAGERARADAELKQLSELPGMSAWEQLTYGLVSAMERGDKTGTREALVARAQVPLPGKMDRSLAYDALGLLDDPAAALRRLRQLLNDPRVQSNIYAYNGYPVWAAYFGDRDLALQGLESMSRQGFSFETYALSMWTPVFRVVRGEPRFKQLLRDMGLVDYWRASGDWGDYCAPVGADDFQCR
jgi:TolB-like protein